MQPAAPQATKTEAVGKRDPFAPLINDKKDCRAEHLPPGKAGLVIATVRVDGTVRSGERNDRGGFESGAAASISSAKVTSLYDGDVEKIGLDGVTFRRKLERRFRETGRASGDEANLRECRRAAMRIIWRALGLGALLAAGLILSNGALRASDAPVVHVKAVVKDGAVRLASGGQRAVRIHHLSPEREPLRARPERRVGGRSGGRARGRLRPGEELPRDLRTPREQSRWSEWKFCSRKGVEPQLERTGNQDLTLAGLADGRSRPSAATPAPTPAKAARGARVGQGLRIIGAQRRIQAIRQVNLAQNGSRDRSQHCRARVRLTYHAMHLQNPDRLVLDFAGSHLKTTEKHIASNLDPVREIRLAQFTPEVSRVVIDLREPARYNIKGDGSTVTVAFERQIGRSSDDGAQPVSRL